MAGSGRSSDGNETDRLPDGIEITEEELSRRKAFLELGLEDIKRLKAIEDLARHHADAMIEDFYAHLLSFEDTRAFFSDPQVLERVKNLQKDYFLRLTQGIYDVAYAQDRLRIGTVHERAGLPVRSYLGMYSFYLRAVAGWLSDAYKASPGEGWATILSLMKLTFLDMGLALDTYIYSRERTIREQQETMQELPTPVLPVREGLLIVPIIGVIDSPRARHLTEQLLVSIRSSRAKVAVIDITGVQSLDSKVANHIIQTVEAARLMGARVIIAGISPEIARTMVTLGIDLGRIATVGDLQNGIARAEQMLGYVVSRTRLDDAGA